MKFNTDILPIECRQPALPRGGLGPVFIVGLPRSGSTLLTHILNQSPDLLIVNDFYFLQEVDAIGASDRCSARQAQHLLDFALSVIRSRCRINEKFDMVRSLSFSNDALIELERHARAKLRKCNSWDDILALAMEEAAEIGGKTRWGYKTPQDFLHLSRLRTVFPGARFVFLLRHPHATLLSYKNVFDEGNDQRRYHPCLQSWLWRSCVRIYLACRRDADVTLIRYEDLIHNPTGTLAALSSFLGVSIPTPDLDSLGMGDSSHRRGNSVLMLGTERWLCDMIAGDAMEALDYKTDSSSHARIQDVPKIIGLTARCALYYVYLALRSRNTRARLAHGIRYFFGRTQP